MFFRMVYKSGPTFLPFCHKARVWQTDRQTDGRTDGRRDRILIARPRLHCMQRGKKNGDAVQSRRSNRVVLFWPLNSRSSHFTGSH